MALFLGQQDKRSELQEKIAADLRVKMQQSKLREDAMIDGVEDTKYLEDTKTIPATTWAWLILAIIMAGVVIVFLAQGNQ